MKPNRDARLTPEKQKLVEDNVRLAYYVVGKYYRDKYLALGEYEDVVQEAMIGLIRAENTYDSGKGYTFATYACRCMETQLATIAKSYRYAKRNLGYEPARLDSEISGASSNPATLGDLVPGPCDVERVVYASLRVDELRAAAAKNGRAQSFEDLERTVLWDCSLAEIGRERGCTRENMRRLVNRMKAELCEREGYLCKTYST